MTACHRCTLGYPCGVSENCAALRPAYEAARRLVAAGRGYSIDEVVRVAVNAAAPVIAANAVRTQP